MVEEVAEGDARDVVELNAGRKAEAVAGGADEGSLVIGGDTEVVVDGELLGQPGGPEEARQHLQRLSGREHQVLGGLALVGPTDPGGGGAKRSGVDASTVTFRQLEPPLLEAYVTSGEWRGRAGAYAIQGLGSALVASVDGDVSNVIGLPVGLLLRLAPELFQSR
jgi:nucleoside triphosphate pyrophosphatase